MKSVASARSRNDTLWTPRKASVIGDRLSGVTTGTEGADAFTPQGIMSEILKFQGLFMVGDEQDAFERIVQDPQKGLVADL